MARGTTRIFHLALHFIVPVIIAAAFFPKQWKMATLIMLVTMLVDIDHLLATPIYQANRCSIGFHPLHSLILMPVYIIASVIPKTRFIGIGLVIHMILDSIDCQINTGVWYSS